MTVNVNTFVIGNVNTFVIGNVNTFVIGSKCKVMRLSILV